LTGCAYIIVLRLILIIVILADIVIVFIILVIELALEIILVEFLKGKGLASEPVDGAGNELLLDILTELVVELQTLLDIGSSIVILIGRGLGRREEVEERLGRYRLLDDTRLLGVCNG